MEKNKNNLEELQKERQKLCSWSWFYSNAKDSIFETRYHKSWTKNKKSEEVLDDVYVSDANNSHYGKAIFYSQRFREDKDKIKKLAQQINDNQLKLNKYFKK